MRGTSAAIERPEDRARRVRGGRARPRDSYKELRVKTRKIQAGAGGRSRSVLSFALDDREHVSLPHTS